MAGTRVEKKLTTLRVKALKEPGKYEDGGGLRIVVEPSGTRRWVLRASINGINGRRVERGLGAFPDISLEAARLKAIEICLAAKPGVDHRAEERKRDVAGTTFRQMFKVSFAQREKQLSNAKHLKQWPSTMEAYVFPTIGDVRVADVSTAQVLDLLTPIWFDKPETANRVLQRLETVFKSAIVRSIRERASPCVGVAEELGTKHREVKHRASLPWQNVPAFVATLRHASGRRLPMTTLPL